MRCSFIVFACLCHSFWVPSLGHACAANPFDGRLVPSHYGWWHVAHVGSTRVGRCLGSCKHLWQTNSTLVINESEKMDVTQRKSEKTWIILNFDVCPHHRFSGDCSSALADLCKLWEFVRVKKQRSTDLCEMLRTRSSVRSVTKDCAVVWKRDRLMTYSPF